MKSAPRLVPSLLRKIRMMMMNIMMTRKSCVKSRVSGFSRAKLEAGKNVLSLEMSPKVVAVCFQGLAI